MCPTAVYKAIFVVTPAILNFLLFHFIIITLQNGLIQLILAKHAAHIDTNPAVYPGNYFLPAPYSNNFRLYRSREPDVHPSRQCPAPSRSHPQPRATHRKGTSRLCPAANPSQIPKPNLGYFRFLDSDSSRLLPKLR